MSAVFWSGFIAAPVVGLCAAIMLARKISYHSILLFLSVAFTAARFGIQCWLYLVDHDVTGFARFYETTLPLAALFNILAGVGIFWAMAANYRNFRLTGTVLITALALLSGVATWATSGIGQMQFGMSPVWLSVSMFLYRHGMTVAGLMTISSRFMLTRMKHTVPLGEWSIRAADLFSAYALTAAGISVFTMITGARFTWAVAFLPIANFIWFSIACAVWLCGAENKAECHEPVSDARYAEASRRARLSEAEFLRSARSGIEKSQ